MSQNEPQNQRRKSGPLEVVSEEQADGSFEIKFQSKEHDTPAPMDSKPKIEPDKPVGDGGGPAAYIGLLAVVALLGVGAWLLFFSPRGNEREPASVAEEIDERLTPPAEALDGEDESSAEGMQRPSSLRQLNRPRRQNMQRTLLRPQDGNLNLDRSTPLRVDPVNRRLLDRPSPTPGVDRNIDRTVLSPTNEGREVDRDRLRQIDEGRRSVEPDATGNRRRRRPGASRPAVGEPTEPPELVDPTLLAEPDDSTVAIEEELPTSEEEVDDYVDDRELEEYEPAWDEEEEIDDEDDEFDDEEYEDDEFDDEEYEDDEFDDEEYEDDEFDDEEYEDDEFDDEEEGYEDEYEEEYY